MDRKNFSLVGISRKSIILLLSIIVLIGSAGCAPIISRAATAEPGSAVAGCNRKQVSITGVHWFKDKNKAWRVVGVIRNDSSKAVSKLETGVETRTSFDRSADQGEDISAYPLNLQPGQEAPFTAWIDRDIPGLDHFEVEITECVLAEPAERGQVEQRNGRLLVDETGTAHVTAELHNPGNKTVLVNGLMAAVYDRSGVLITAQYADVTPRYLSPGESGPVRASMDLPAGAVSKAASYSLFMDVLINQPEPLPLKIEKDIQLLSQYTDEAGHFHQIGQITNSGTTGVMTSLQATVFSSTARKQVVDASQLTTWVPLMPGETLPFDLSDWGPLNHNGGKMEQGQPVDLRLEPFLTWTAVAEVKDLALSDGNISFVNGNALFTGKVTNNSASGITSGSVTVVLRQKLNGQIIAVGTAHLGITDSVAPGQTLFYSITVPLPPGTDSADLGVDLSAKGYQP